MGQQSECDRCRVGDEMTTEKPPVITPDMAGCWLDGHYGWHNNYRVIEVAQDYGLKLTHEEQQAVDAFVDYSDDETVETVLGQGGLTDRATDYLNDLAPRGSHFEWDCGELSLVEDGEEEF